MECPLWCLLSDRRRHIEHLWRRRLLVTADERRARRRFLRLMRGFDAEDVDVLRRAVESEGRDARQCAPGPPMDEREEETPATAEDSGLIPQIDRPMSMPYLCCKLWRWRELQVDAALHTLDALPWCRFGRVTINNATVSCCNPFHYALWIRADSSSEECPLPEASSLNCLPSHIPRPHNSSTPSTALAANGHLVQGEKASVMCDGLLLPPVPPPPPPSDTRPASPDGLSCSSLPPAVPSPPSQANNSAAWGVVQRWERRQKVAEPVHLVPSFSFAAIGHLASAVHDAQPVATDWDTRNDVSFALIRQPGNDIWLYNSGSRSLFVSVVSSLRVDALRRLSPGYCVRVFRASPSPMDCQAVISVGAGWGSGYDRPSMQDTRVRYEISFAGCAS